MTFTPNTKQLIPHKDAETIVQVYNTETTKVKDLLTELHDSLQRLAAQARFSFHVRLTSPKFHDNYEINLLTDLPRILDTLKWRIGCATWSTVLEQLNIRKILSSSRAAETRRYCQN